MLVVDGTGGLVTGAAAERMGGHGSITVVHIGARADASDLVDKFNFPASTKQMIRRCHLSTLSNLLPGACPCSAGHKIICSCASLCDWAVSCCHCIGILSAALPFCSDC